MATDGADCPKFDVLHDAPEDIPFGGIMTRPSWKGRALAQVRSDENAFALRVQETQHPDLFWVLVAYLELPMTRVAARVLRRHKSHARDLVQIAWGSVGFFKLAGWDPGFKISTYMCNVVTTRKAIQVGRKLDRQPDMLDRFNGMMPLPPSPKKTRIRMINERSARNRASGQPHVPDNERLPDADRKDHHGLGPRSQSNLERRFRFLRDRTSEGPLEACIATEATENLDSAVRKLAPYQYQVYQLRFGFGHSCSEIAATLDKSCGGVRRTVSGILKKLLPILLDDNEHSAGVRVPR